MSIVHRSRHDVEARNRAPLVDRLRTTCVRVQVALGARLGQALPPAIQRAWCRLTCPAPQIEAVEGQFQARLLSLLLLLALPLTLWLGLVFAWPPKIVSCEVLTALTSTALLVAYGLSRTRYYRVAVLILIAALLVVSLVGSGLNHNAAVVLYFSFTALVAITFLTPRSALALVVGINAYVIVGLPVLVPDEALAAMAIERSFVIALSVIISVIALTQHLARQTIAQQTERLLVAEQERAALSVERQRIQVLRQFLQNASHDIRTPLSSIRLSLELLDNMLYEEQKPRLDKLRQQTHHLERILLDMLELSRLDADDELQFDDDVDLVELVTYVHGSLCEVAQRFNHAFVFEPSRDVVMLRADAHYLKHAIKNILENALHYTDHGGTITVRTYADADRAVIEVEDNGIGIAAEELPLIFERFYRADGARNTGSGGAGLGLSISQRIVDLHNGEIRVESVPGSGTVFRVCLPRA